MGRPRPLTDLSPPDQHTSKKRRPILMHHFYAFSLFFLCPLTLAFVIFMALQAA